MPVQYGGKRGWIRSRTIINGKEKNKKIIGVLENYDEQKEKEAEIEHHLKRKATQAQETGKRKKEKRKAGKGR